MLLLNYIFYISISNFIFQCHAYPDLGAPGYTCDASLMAPSKVVPTNAHSVRPADIKLTMALGDSLSAGQGANCNFSNQDRGVTFSEGGDLGLDQHVTIPNILQKYNPNLFGQSHGIGSFNDWSSAYLNMAVPGQTSVDLRAQAYSLVNALKAHNGTQIDIQNDWKLLTIFIGTNDICGAYGYCVNPGAYSADSFMNYIKQAVNIVRAAVPRVIVNLVLMNHVEIMITTGNEACHFNHCPVCWAHNYTVADLAQLVLQYQEVENALETNGTFDTTDDFTLVAQPFFANVTSPPLKNGSYNRDFFSIDCFHWSTYGHAVIASYLWQNMLQPVGMKNVQANLSAPALPLSCPDVSCPFIRTTKNSANCQMYYTEPAW